MSPVMSIVMLVLAHGGEDHGPAAAAPAPAGIVGDTRGASTMSDQFELVLRWSAEGAGGGDAVTMTPVALFLADRDTNAPIAGAGISLRWVDGSGAQSEANATATSAPGIYRAEMAGPAGLYALTAVITAGDRGDLLTVAELRFGPAPAGPGTSDSTVPTEGHGLPWLWIGLALGALVIVGLTGFLAGRAAGRRGGQAAGVVLALVAAAKLAATPAGAHGGEDHGEPAAPGVTSASDSHAIAKDLQFLLAIRTTPAVETGLTERIRAQGTVIAPPDALAEVRPLRAGRLEVDVPPTSADPSLDGPDAGFPTLGQTVKAGQVLAVVVELPAASERATLSADRARARGGAEQAQARVGALRAELKRKEQLPESTSLQALEGLRAEIRALDAEIRASQAAGAALALDGESVRLPLIAPIDGVIAAIAPGLAVGGFVAADTALFTIVQPERFEIAAHVFEADAPGVALGGAAVVTGPGLPAAGIAAVARGAAPRVDPATHAVEIRYRPDGADAARLRLYQFVTVDVPVGPPTAAATVATLVVVPESAILEVDGRPTVFVKTAPETFIARPVAIVRREGGRVGVRGQLAAGERVVVAGASFVGLAPAPVLPTAVHP